METILNLYLAGTGMTFEPVRVPFPSFEVCLQNVERERARGHKAWCSKENDFGPIQCANCNGLDTPIPRG